MKVFVYYNMHRKTWSIKALEGVNKGRVVAHSNYVVVSNPIGQVSLKSRESVLLTGRKNVHAGIVGELQSIGLPLEVRGLMGTLRLLLMILTSGSPLYTRTLRNARTPKALTGPL
jgi:hypothetical protein